MSNEEIPEDVSDKIPETIVSMPKPVPVKDWKIWARRTLYITYFTFMLLIIPVLIWKLVRKGAEFELIIWFLAGMATCFAVPISLWGILNHLIYFTQPKLQRHIIRILWMVPIYGVFSWLALSFPSEAVYLDAVREIYQAYVVYNFITYLINFLTDEYDMKSRMQEKPPVKSPPPCCCFKAGANELIINRCKYGVLNYTVSRPILTIIAVICEATSNDNNSQSISLTRIGITIALAASQLWAIYCLVLLYQSTRGELQPLHNPHAQFLCIKMTIFGANFQGLIIAILVGTEVLKPNPDWGITDPTNNNAAFAALIQDFVVCFEMIIAAFAHAYSFSHRPYKYMGVRPSFTKSLKMMFDVSDVAADVSSHVKRFGRKVKRKCTKKTSDDSELMKNEVVPDDSPMEVNDSQDGDDGGECDLGMVTQINNVTYSVNGTVQMYQRAPGDNHMAPRDEGGSAHSNNIVDILGQAEDTLEASAAKNAKDVQNSEMDSFVSDIGVIDLGIGSASEMPTMQKVSTTKKRNDKKGHVIDNDLDCDGVMTFERDMGQWVNDSEA